MFDIVAQRLIKSCTLSWGDDQENTKLSTICPGTGNMCLRSTGTYTKLLI